MDNADWTKVRERSTIIPCPNCGHHEPFDAIRCSQCQTIVRRCIDCTSYNRRKQVCNAREKSISKSEAENPTETSVSVRCEEMRPFVS